MKVHALASYPHYRRHVDAVWRHLPAGLAGQQITGNTVADRRLPEDDVMLIAGAYDIPRARGRRTIYIEHGAGQSYWADPKAFRHANYHGGIHPDNVIAYIAPSKQVADSWSKPSIAVGCPALDGAFQRRAATEEMPVVFTFHADFRLCPETRSARAHYLEHLPAMIQWIRDQGHPVYGHWHPRDPVGERIWRNLGVPTLDVDETLERAALLIADNTSLMYEAAAIGIPVLALNAPWYRRDVHHGLRFWEHIPGDQLNEWTDLLDIDLVEYMLSNDGVWKRYDVSRHVYAIDPLLDIAGPEAAQWVCDLLDWE